MCSVLDRMLSKGRRNTFYEVYSPGQTLALVGTSRFCVTFLRVSVWWARIGPFHDEETDVLFVAIIIFLELVNLFLRERSTWGRGEGVGRLAFLPGVTWKFDVCSEYLGMDSVLWLFLERVVWSVALFTIVVILLPKEFHSWIITLWPDKPSCFIASVLRERWEGKWEFGKHIAGTNRGRNLLFKRENAVRLHVACSKSKIGFPCVL